MSDAEPTTTRKERLDALGLCRRCGKRKRAKERVNCQKCIDKASADTIARRRANPEAHNAAERARVAECKRLGLCIKCKVVEAQKKPRRVKCADCLASTNASVKKAQAGT